MEKMNDYVQLKKFAEIDLSDTFFDSLKEDYVGFDIWFKKKQSQGEQAYVMLIEEKISGFMYLKEETESIQLKDKKLNSIRRMKIGTFKLNTRGTILGDRFLALALRDAVKAKHERVYVTVFEKHEKLVRLFKRFGFQIAGETQAGELFLGKRMNYIQSNPYANFPRISLSDPAYSLAIKADYHTRLFPDSRLQTETGFIVEDLAQTNTVTKTYLCNMKRAENLKPNDLLFIYRMAESHQIKTYHSVITSVCTVVEVKKISDFKDYESYLKYIGKGTIFTTNELNTFWKTKKFPIIIKMLYNFPMNKKVILNDFADIIEKPIVGTYWGLVDFDLPKAEKLLERGKVSESFIIDKT